MKKFFILITTLIALITSPVAAQQSTETATRIFVSDKTQTIMAFMSGSVGSRGQAIEFQDTLVEGALLSDDFTVTSVQEYTRAEARELGYDSLVFLSHEMTDIYPFGGVILIGTIGSEVYMFILVSTDMAAAPLFFELAKEIAEDGIEEIEVPFTFEEEDSVQDNEILPSTI